jgi:uncharacterized membrane protein (DUF2068 family)
MIIGTFEIAIGLLGLIGVILIGRLDAGSIGYLTLLAIYGAMGAGLWAIQEWARFTSVVLHMVAIPYTIYTALFLGWPQDWRLVSQLLISGGIIFALTRPEIRHKFQTVVPKERR